MDYCFTEVFDYRNSSGVLFQHLLLQAVSPSERERRLKGPHGMGWDGDYQQQLVTAWRKLCYLPGMHMILHRHLSGP